MEAKRNGCAGGGGDPGMEKWHKVMLWWLWRKKMVLDLGWRCHERDSVIRKRKHAMKSEDWWMFKDSKRKVIPWEESEMDMGMICMWRNEGLKGKWGCHWCLVKTSSLEFSSENSQRNIHRKTLCFSVKLFKWYQVLLIVEVCRQQIWKLMCDVSWWWYQIMVHHQTSWDHSESWRCCSLAGFIFSLTDILSLMLLLDNFLNN